MIKRGLLILALAVFAATGAFAQIAFSAGLGAYFSGDFGGGATAKYRGAEVMKEEFPYFGGGGFFFVDATYIEASLGFFSGSGKWKYAYNIPGVLVGSDTIKTSGTSFDLGLMVKYPFSMNKRLTVFPLLGITYRAMVSAKQDNVEITNPEDISALWFKLGGGMDYSFSDNFFLRAEVLYGLRLKNQLEKDEISDGESIGFDVQGRRGHGPDIKIAVGQRF